MRRLFFFLFFLSGFSALVYEVVWARQLGLVFGNTVYAVSTILAIFFAGLALGSGFFGWVVDRVKKPLLIYGFLEVGIGIYCFWTPFLFNNLVPMQVLLWEKLGYFSSFLLTFLVLILPTVLMGGTFPVIVRFLVRQEKERGEVMGNLYGLNTLGAVLGAFLAGFFLIRYFGVKETIWLAAGVNLLIGILVLALNRRAAHIEIGSISSINAQRSNLKKKSFSPQFLSPKPYTLYPNFILLVFFLNGFAALSLEVLWTRVLILTFGSSTYAFAMILTVFLLGIALGSFLAGKLLVRSNSLLLWLVGLEIALGAAVILISPLLGELPLMFLSFYRGEIDFSTNLWAAFWLSFLVLLPPTFLMGATFPLGAKILTANFKKLGRDLGKIYSVNTLGGIFGSLAAGFILTPLLGLQKGILVSALFYFLAGILVISLLPWARKVKVGITLVILFLAASALFLPSWDKNVLSSGVFVYFPYYLGNRDVKTVMEKGKILFYKEGLSATVVVKREGKDLYMRINGKTDASTSGDRENFLLTGHLPLVLHSDPKEVLIIGLGSGITLGAVEQHQVEKIDLVEIEPAVAEGAKLFSSYNHNALEDKRLKIFVNDGRHFLLTTDQKYDVISSQPSNLWIAGMGNLFTQEYYQLASTKLKEGGLMLQWLQLYYFSPDDLKTAVATFQSIFPHVSGWVSPFANDLLLIGSKAPLKIDLEKFDQKIKEEKIQQDLKDLGINEASALLGYFLVGEGKLKEFTQGAKFNTDNHPLLEFSAPFSLGKETSGKNLEMLLSFQEGPYSFISNLLPPEKGKIEMSLKLKENLFRAKNAVAEHDAQQALFFYEEALKLDPQRKQIKKELTSLYFDIAEEAFLERDFNKAKEALSKAIEVDPDNVLAHSNLGRIYYQEGNLLEAIKEWKIAESIDPENPEVKKNLELFLK